MRDGGWVGGCVVSLMERLQEEIKPSKVWRGCLVIFKVGRDFGDVFGFVSQ